MKNNNKILVIGAIPHVNDPKSYGGTTTLMQNFLDFCKNRSYPISHIDTFHYSNRIANFAYFFCRFFQGLFSCRYIMFNCAQNGAFTLFYHLAPIAFFFKKKVIFRKFGGFFDKQLDEHPEKKEKLLRLCDKSNLIFFETKSLVQYFQHVLSHPENIEWFPNCRKPSLFSKTDNSYRKRFVFISHLREDKGIDLIIQAANQLPEDYIIDLYGSVYDAKYNDPDYFNNTRLNYLGALKTEEVLPILSRYDVLLLPTYCATEGYPGIIIEAMSLAIPSIATKIGGICEIVSDGENGLLIPIKDADALRVAMTSINEDDYTAMSLKAKERFNIDFNSDVVNERIYRRIMSI